MLRKLMALTVILIVAMFLLGNKDNRDYVERTERILVGYGDTLDGIAGDFYKRDKRGVSWAEYRNEIMNLNEKLQNRSRCIQPGDMVEIKYYE